MARASSQASGSTLASLEREVAALKKEVAALKKQLASKSKSSRGADPRVDKLVEVLKNNADNWLAKDFFAK